MTDDTNAPDTESEKKMKHAMSAHQVNRFGKGDLVVFAPRGDTWAGDRGRVVRKPFFKPRPWRSGKYAKRAGWWYRVSLDPMPAGLKSAWVEIHESGLRPYIHTTRRRRDD